MDTEDKRPDERPVARRRFQYSLRTLLLITTLVAIVCSLLIASPSWVRALSILCLIPTIPAVLTIVLVYGRGYMRTFCIGALFPSVWITISFGWIFFRFSMDVMSMDGNTLSQLGEPLTATLVVSIALSLVVGLIAIGTRWWIELPQRRNPPDTSPRE
jgi:hypothetical protein